jgi:hypothetical protein
VLEEIDCANGKNIYPSPMNFYDKKGNIIYSDSKLGEWADIIPYSHIEILKNKVCSAGKTAKTIKK